MESPGREPLPPQVLIHQLSLEALVADSRQKLHFRLLNRPFELVRYDRATLWDLSGRAPACLGVSGQSGVNRESQALGQRQRLAAALADPDQAGIIRPEALGPEARQAWEEMDRDLPGLALLWVPVQAWGRPAAGLLFERWGGPGFEPTDLALLMMLFIACNAAWERLHPPTLHGRLARFCSRQRWPLALAAFLLLNLLLWRVPLRVAAPCEVVPRSPFVVTAPLAGVVEEVKVRPGQQVKAGDILFVYDRRVADEEFKAALQQVRIMESAANRAALQAFQNENARNEMDILRFRLEQEKIRLALAADQVGRLEVRAEADGLVFIDDPHEWRGRAVGVGEKVLMVVLPYNTKVKAWIPEQDNVEFDREAPVDVLLNAFPESARLARLTSLAPAARPSPQGVQSILAEAEWDGPQADVKVGLQGTATLRGEKVPVLYWLARKPLAQVRRVLGF